MESKTITHVLNAMMLCIIAIMLAAIFFLAVKNSTLTAQLETIEPELPTGYMQALDEQTVTRLDIFCADWGELRDN